MLKISEEIALTEVVKDPDVKGGAAARPWGLAMSLDGVEQQAVVDEQQSDVCVPVIQMVQSSVVHELVHRSTFNFQTNPSQLYSTASLNVQQTSQQPFS